MPNLETELIILSFERDLIDITSCIATYEDIIADFKLQYKQIQEKIDELTGAKISD